ncbi:protein-L-isoaspartate O-methyltransferase family protein [Alkalilacustris brevis]|uniref:protein-L-isoaspartate O-methyltransferase family protein n=1 Tax=Alkalilacustris brevis TaxID=2026338 RepID=UPI000E0D11F5|nr:protein-L-isoaspartate O-methyltransferase [Alkalilacustris brevis]
MPDYAARRRMMVDTQVRPSDVTKFPIIEAMLDVPREAFVPEALREAAYVGTNLEIAAGRVMLEPRTLSKMLDALVVGPRDLVLDIGCGFGYSTVILARLAEAVVGLEDSEDMAEEAAAILDAQLVDNATIIAGPLAGGAPQHGPYDVIVVQGGIEELPAAIEEQLKEGGRIACVFMEGSLGVCRLGRKSGGQIAWRDIFNAAAPVLAGFERKPEFTF